MKMLTFLLGLALASGASAQSQWATRDVASRLAMADFATCVAKAKPALAARAVIEDWDAEALFAHGRDAIKPLCRGATEGRALRYHLGDLRAALADRMIASNPGLTLTPAQLSAASPLAYRMPWPVRTTDARGRALPTKQVAGQTLGHNRRVALITGQQIAECLVRATPVRVRAVFATPIASVAEATALKALMPALPSCASARKFNFDRNSLRGSLAMAYYRLVMAGRGQAWAGAPASATGSDR